jgi:cell division protein FtsN
MANYPNKKSNIKRTPRAMPRRASNKRFLMGAMLAFLGGYVLACFYSPMAIKALFEPKALVTPPAMNATTMNTVTLPKPKFEFYTLLTQEKTVAKIKPSPEKAVPEKAAPQTPVSEKIVSETAVRTEAPGSKYTYLVQLASFQRQEDAEQLKANLIMRGFDARIKTASQSGGVWHRVVLGPFVSRQVAEKTQADIVKSEHISGIIRRMDA